MTAAAESLRCIRVLVADDQRVVRDGLSTLLGFLPGVEVVGTAIDGTDAVRQSLAAAPDVILMDLNMPNCDGVEATRRIVLEQPGVRVVVLTAYSDDESVFAALRAGARGFLTKDAGALEIFQALSAVAAGEAGLDPSVQRRLIEAVTRGDSVAVPDSANGDGAKQAWPSDGRRQAARFRRDREDPHQSSAGQDGVARPGTTCRLRVPSWPGPLNTTRRRRDIDGTLSEGETGSDDHGHVHLRVREHIGNTGHASRRASLQSAGRADGGRAGQTGVELMSPKLRGPWPGADVAVGARGLC